MADLTARQVETTTKVGYTADRKQPGLNLQVTAGAGGYARSWVFRYTSPITQKRREKAVSGIAILAGILLVGLVGGLLVYLAGPPLIKAISAMPPSLAIVIGAVIIAAAVKRR